MSHRAMKDLAENPAAVRALAGGLLALGRAEPPVEWSDWKLDFLESMATHDKDDPLSTRQREKLVELRDDAQRYSTIEGLSVVRLVGACAVESLELPSEDDQQFIADLQAAGLRSLTRRQLARLLRIARTLGVIEPHQGFIG